MRNQNKIVLVLDGLVITKPILQSLRERVKKTNSDIEKVHSLVKEITYNIDQDNYETDDSLIFYFFNASAYYLAGHIKISLHWLKKSYDSFSLAGPSSETKWNKVLILWIYEDVLTRIGKKGLAKSRQKETVRLLETLSSKFQPESNWEEYEKANTLLKIIKQPEKKTSISLARLLGFQKSSKLSRLEDTPGPPSEGKSIGGESNHQEGKQIIFRSGYELMHITVPVDLNALKTPDLPSTMLDNQQYGQLYRYNQKKNGLVIESTNDIFYRHIPSYDMLIPSYPIYGVATANPDGGYLEENGDAPIVTDNNLIEFDQALYEVKFIDQSNQRPTIPLNGNYGWLKIMGNSMNALDKPKPIKSNDYVFFKADCDFELCINKIVIALLPENDNQPVQPMVKKLLFNQGDFSLHSISKEDYEDVKISSDFQLSGKVLAIAYKT